MMNTLHLLWIVPLSMLSGVFATALIVGGTRDDY